MQPGDLFDIQLEYYNFLAAHLLCVFIVLSDRRVCALSIWLEVGIILQPGLGLLDYVITHTIPIQYQVLVLFDLYGFTLTLSV